MLKMTQFSSSIDLKRILFAVLLTGAVTVHAAEAADHPKPLAVSDVYTSLAVETFHPLFNASPLFQRVSTSADSSSAPDLSMWAEEVWDGQKELLYQVQELLMAQYQERMLQKQQSDLIAAIQTQKMTIQQRTAYLALLAHLTDEIEQFQDAQLDIFLLMNDILEFHEYLYEASHGPLI